MVFGAFETVEDASFRLIKDPEERSSSFLNATSVTSHKVGRVARAMGQKCLATPSRCLKWEYRGGRLQMWKVTKRGWTNPETSEELLLERCSCGKVIPGSGSQHSLAYTPVHRCKTKLRPRSRQGGVYDRTSTILSDRFRLFTAAFLISRMR